MNKEYKYKGKTIEVKFPSGMFEYYSDKEGRFLKFDTLKDAKESINKEGKSIDESIKPKTQKIKLSELRQLVKEIIKEDPKKKITGWPDLSASPDFGEYLGFDTKGGYKNTQSVGGGYYDTLNKDNKKLSDISYLGDWKKTSDKSPYFDKFKGEIDMSPNYEPARKNPINTPPPKLDKIPKIPAKEIPKIPAKEIPKLTNDELFNMYLKNGIDRIVQTNQQKNWQSVLSLVNSLYNFNDDYFESVYKHQDYNNINQKIEKISDKSELIDLYNELQTNFKNVTNKLTTSYNGTYESVKKILNDIRFYYFITDDVRSSLKYFKKNS
jgi:hypothetical protein